MIQPYLYRWSISTPRERVTIFFLLCIFLIALVTAIGIWKATKQTQRLTVEKQLHIIQVKLLQVTAFENSFYNTHSINKLHTQKTFAPYQALLKQLSKDLETVSIEAQEKNYPIRTHIDSLIVELQLYEGLLQQMTDLQKQLSQEMLTLSKEPIRSKTVALLDNKNLTTPLFTLGNSPYGQPINLNDTISINRLEELSLRLSKQRIFLNSSFASLLIQWNNNTLEADFQDKLILVGMVLIALLGSIFLGVFFYMAIIKPIYSLNNRITEQVKSEVEKQEGLTTLQRWDDISNLINNFDLLVSYHRSRVEEMTERIKLLTIQNQDLQAINHKITLSEQELLKLHTVKDKFFSILSHDLKGPLHTLTGFLGILKSHAETFTVKELQDFAQEMDISVGRLLELLSNLLKWSLAQTGNINYKPSALSLNGVVTSNIALLSETAKLKSVKLTYQENTGTELFADKDMLDFILRNLLTNAIKFSNENGLVQVKTKRLDSMLAIAISDNGIGIGQEEIKKLFQSQHHFSTPGTANEKGTGFGLLLCKEFISLHGGSIFINSKLGEGTCITFTLPIANLDNVSNSLYEEKVLLYNDSKS